MKSTNTNEITSNPLVVRFGSESRWLEFRHELINGRMTKVPYHPNGFKADTTDPSTWSTYEKVSTELDNGSNGFDGLGIVFCDGMFGGVDIDHVLVDGEIIHPQRETIIKFLEQVNTYTEISPSGTGLHVYFGTAQPFFPVANKKIPFEYYTKGRYFTVTGNSYHQKPKQIRVFETTEEVVDVLSIIGYPWGKKAKTITKKNDVNTVSLLSDDKLLKKMFSSKNGSAIKKLYDGDISKYNGDDSGADMALCSHLAFWTGNNEEQIERIWLSSPLGQREKTQQRRDYVTRTIANAIDSKEIYQTHNNDKQKETQADVFLDIIEKNKSILLFHDERNNPYISLEIDDHIEIWPCNQKAKDIKNWLVGKYWETTQRVPNAESIKSAIGILESKARFNGVKHTLNNRFACKDNDFWYDLTNDKRQAVKINKNGWEVINKPPTLFRRFPHHSPQVAPDSKGDIKLILKYVNITNQQHTLLLLVYIVSCFIPDFAHVILIIFGSQGSAKSTLAKMVKQIIDPSFMEVVSLTENHKELIQALDHNAFIFFDNVSFISDTTSDILCKASTGSGFIKRELYSDDGDIIYNFKRCMAINGINLVATRPDLLERSLLIELERIDPSNRKTEKEIKDSFQEDLPLIIGGVFDVLVKTLNIKSNLSLTNVKLPRMADFSEWGCAISEALGFTKEDFLEAYQSNIDDQTETALNENVVASVLISFIEEKGDWEGTASHLLRDLNLYANTSSEIDTIDSYEKNWPKGSNALMRKLNEVSVNLKASGILLICTRGKKRRVILRRIAGNSILPKMKVDGIDDNVF
ncbi:MAG: hypothetical protein WCP17_03110 [bacterium]